MSIRLYSALAFEIVTRVTEKSAARECKFIFWEQIFNKADLRKSIENFFRNDISNLIWSFLAIGKVDINKKDAKGFTLLMRAAYRGFFFFFFPLSFFSFHKVQRKKSSSNFKNGVFFFN